MRADTLLYCIHANAGLEHPVRQRGVINAGLPPIIDRLSIEPDNWIALTKGFEKNTKTFVGTESHI